MNILEQTCRKIFPQDSQSRDYAQEAIGRVLPQSVLYKRLFDLAVDLAGITRGYSKPFTRQIVVSMTGDHGFCRATERVTEEGNQLFDRCAIVDNDCLRLCTSRLGTDLLVVDMGLANGQQHQVQDKLIQQKVGLGTNDSTKGAAMSIAAARSAVERGISVAESLSEYELIGVSDSSGKGGLIAALAIAAVLTEKPVDELIDEKWPAIEHDSVEIKRTVGRILDRNKPDRKNGLQVLSAVGGFEIGGIAGLIIGAAAQRKPVIIDGLTALAGALIACCVEPFIRDFVLIGNNQQNRSFHAMLDIIGGNKPILHIEHHPGDGSGAAIAMTIVNLAQSFLAHAKQSMDWTS